MIASSNERQGASRRCQDDNGSERQGASRRFRNMSSHPAIPAASALPLTRKPPRELAAIDAELKGVTHRIVQMIGGLSK